jgi:hypothetical protein
MDVQLRRPVKLTKGLQQDMHTLVLEQPTYEANAQWSPMGAGWGQSGKVITPNAAGPQFHRTTQRTAQATSEHT